MTRDRARLRELAWTLHRQGRTEEALGIHRRLLAEDPEDRFAAIDLAALSAHVGRHDDALRFYRRAYDICVAKGRPVTGVIARARGRPPYHPAALEWCANAYLALGMWDEAEATYRTLAARLDELRLEHQAARVHTLLRHLDPTAPEVM